ncbi:hypothetical protein [Acidipropionibacterium jensenii]|uniref:hypothetical protein n=1 Tax=Acidipropionibacterium jensenii TaxID=1749 RepID=UPI002647F309|nr:hypothetical protein [Acidipropionibacterium jensenii]MDN5977096.1 hypothetical protein [Acidipropionibacterium jensenii]MDN5995939.1 hypothetical protein [Acidipropionibacterium jensenii]MDN6426189.1 hypothetical protein [Acidipropionibacterium jensenii]MDN6440967.1 hypothetical protein [Acidipropionibacterium jensenii]MDN6480182.1 hypothetical protein [Acidipropionibacterium jensenii]
MLTEANSSPDITDRERTFGSLRQASIMDAGTRVRLKLSGTATVGRRRHSRAAITISRPPRIQ